MNSLDVQRGAEVNSAYFHNNIDTRSKHVLPEQMNNLARDMSIVSAAPSLLTKVLTTHPVEVVCALYKGNIPADLNPGFKEATTEAFHTLSTLKDADMLTVLEGAIAHELGILELHEKDDQEGRLPNAKLGFLPYLQHETLSSAILSRRGDLNELLDNILPSGVSVPLESTKV